MTDYRHPYRDAEFVLNELVGFENLCAEAGLDEINNELASVILTEAGKLGADFLAPLNMTGDTQGARFTPEGVSETPGFSQAYQSFVENGWGSLTAQEQYGGQGLPNVLGIAVDEIWHSANMAFALCPMLTQGAIAALEHHGSEELKTLYLPPLISGEWSGTMNLTEPDAGSDLAAIKSRAIPAGDHYLISGQKIFITWGDHQMAENIVHLVLARLPDAPAGVKGISLFVVPKYLVDAEGNIGAKNDVACLSIEHKLGIHGSPTCVMGFGENQGAVGYLIGDPHNGLAYMFTMMNHARQSVGLQGLAISERAYQQASEYARERIQGTRKDGSRFSIIQFPDVRRMLMQMRASVEAMRGLAFVAAAEIDRADYSKDAQDKARHAARVDLLTPIVKGWLTELAQEVTSLGIQVHGGMGYIEETGAAQHFRDARILTIYEGTTGIQALDLCGRKTLLNEGAYLAELLSDMADTATALQGHMQTAVFAKAFSEAVTAGVTARQWLLDNRADAASVSVNFMLLMGYLCGGWVMAQAALRATTMLAEEQGDPEFLQAKIITARFYMEHLLPRVQAYLTTVMAGSASVMALDEAQF